MFLLEIYFKNLKLNGSGRFIFHSSYKTIKKWTFFPEDAKTLELMRLMAAVCVGKKFLPHLTNFIEILQSPGSEAVHLESVIARHVPRDCFSGSPLIVAEGFRILSHGKLLPLKKKDCHYIPKDVVLARKLSFGTGIRKNFAIALGSILEPHEGTDCFDFINPNFRVVRFQTLFDSTSRVTDVPAFINRLLYRAFVGRLPAKRTLHLISSVFRDAFSIQLPENWDKKIDFHSIWNHMQRWQKRIILPIVDTIRHLMDASPHEFDPLARHGIIFLQNPYKYCPKERFTTWIQVMDFIFPNLQFFVSLPRKFIDVIPCEIGSKILTVPEDSVKQSNHAASANLILSPKTVLLIDVDGKMPNVALMKLSGFYKKKGFHTELARPRHKDSLLIYKGAEKVYASCIFNFPSSYSRLREIQRIFTKDTVVGGSGIDLHLRLPNEIERTTSDFDLYPELKDRAIGFLTRGCKFNCSFCIVPKKEGRPRKVSGLDDLLQGRKKVILLDDNILSYPEADAILDEMIKKDLEVNFNQTLDIRLVDKERAKLIRKIKCKNYNFTRSNFHFSLNDIKNLDLVRRNYEFFGFQRKKDNVEFICMYGFNTTLAEDVERFRFLRSLPGAYVFVQEHKPILYAKEANLKDFFDDHADELIDELIKILFPQNMKSMERYYKWLSQKYFEAFGKPHNRLVDTIFKYNNRDRKGIYLSKMNHKKCMPALNK